MKKTVCMLLVVCMVFSLTACGAAKPAEPEIKDWARSGYFTDENENMLSVTWMDDIDEPGWYVGCMLGEDFIEDSWGGTVAQEGNTLHGTLSSSGSKKDITVTILEEGADGLLLTVEGGETYHFTSMGDMTASIIVTINTDGWGMIGYEAGETVPELDPEWPYQSAQVNLAEPETYTFAAAPEAGNLFVKWMKNGEDFSTEPVITVLLDESADYVAVFEEDADWQNPVMNFIGEYQSGRAHALVECFGDDEAWITIEWGASAWELARWAIVGRLDTDTLTIEYEGANKIIVTVDDSGEENVEDVYGDGTGTITFHDDGTFTWHEDQSEYGADMLFEWVPVNPAPVREDGERFESVIILEGMEETVQYEHIINEALGFEMDYDYESFERYSDPKMECFISVWDGPGNPENFLEVTCRAEDAESVAASVKAELSGEYDLTESTRELDRAGECIYIEASVLKGTNTMADQLQSVYIIPAPDGCFVATAHYAVEAAEGFARRFNYMINTISAI